MAGMAAPTPIELNNVEALDLNRIARTVASGIKDQGADAEGEVHHPAQLDRYNHASTVILVKDIADILVKQYPGWAWAVQPDERGGVINIFNLHCHTEMGFTIRMDDIADDPQHKWAYRAGGELLERFRMPTKLDTGALKEAPRDSRGMLIPNLTDFEESRLKRNAEVAYKLATGEWSIVETENGRYLRTHR
jgi:hypothetical protein